MPCPFCGAKANFGEVVEGENFGGQFIECTNAQCGCSTCLMFPSKCSVKELLSEKWNARSGDDLRRLRQACRTECALLRDALASIKYDEHGIPIEYPDEATVLSLLAI